MKPRILAALLLMLGPVVSAEDVASHKARMDAAQELKDDLRDALDAKSRTKALEAAQRLVKSGKAEERYWKSGKVGAAVALASQNLSASSRIVAAIKVGNYERANLAFSDLERTCRSCHDLHPEKPGAAASKVSHF